MPSRLLIDNWTLQNAGELLQGEHRGEFAHELNIAESSTALRYDRVPQDVVALSCLCQLIQNVVLADQLVVEAAFMSAWSDLPRLAPLTRHALIAGRSFREHESEWVAHREALADGLSACSHAIRQCHEQNKRDYALTGVSSHRMLAQVVWGTAGMLARSHVSGLPYVSHPLRERLLLRSPILQATSGAQSMLTNFIDGKRLQLFERTDLAGVYGRLRLPPLVVRVVEESASLTELLPAAIALRKEYAELRHWLGELQVALSAEDTREIAARQRLLQGISEHLDKLSGDRGASGVSVEFGIVNGLPQFGVKVDMSTTSFVSAFLSRFGIRAQINRLVLAPAGQKAFRRLLRLLGVDGTERAAALEQAFLAFQMRQ